MKHIKMKKSTRQDLAKAQNHELDVESVDAATRIINILIDNVGNMIKLMNALNI